MPDWWGSGPPQLGVASQWTPAWVRPPENWRNRRCRVRVQGPESSAKGHSHVEKPLQPVQGLVLTGSHPGHLALKMTLSALAFQSPPETSTTEHSFCFDPVSSFFLELLVIALCWSCSCPVSYWTPSDLGAGWGGALIGYHTFCLCILFMGSSWQEYWEEFPFPPPWINFVRTLHYVLSLVWPHVA